MGIPLDILSFQVYLDAMALLLLGIPGSKINALSSL